MGRVASVIAIVLVLGGTGPLPGHASTKVAKRRSRSPTTTMVKRRTTRPTTAGTTTTTPTTPPTQEFTVPTGPLTEISGCAITRADPDTIWLHNDSGNAPQLFAVDLRTKKVRSVDVAGAELVDWEDMSPLPDGGVIIGDIGDNERSRTSVDLYRIADLTTSPLAAERRSLTYDDGAHDAEALVVDPDRARTEPAVYVITKEASGSAGVYRADGAALHRVASVAISGEALIFPNLITAADALPDGSGIIMRTYQYAYLFRKRPGQPFADAFTVKPIRIPLPFLPQAEALCMTPNGRTAITTTESRGAPTVTFVLFTLP